MFNEGVENVATPFTAVTVVVPASVEPPGFAPSPNVAGPLYDDTTALLALRSSATTAGVTAAPATWLAAGCAVNTQLTTVLVPVADTEAVGRPALLIANACVPTVLPSVHAVLNRPSESVTPVLGVTEPPPAVTATLTGTPAFALPFASVTSATTGWASRVPMSVVCALPDAIANVAAAPATTVNALLVAPTVPVEFTESV